MSRVGQNLKILMTIWIMVFSPLSIAAIPNATLIHAINPTSLPHGPLNSEIKHDLKLYVLNSPLFESPYNNLIASSGDRLNWTYKTQLAYELEGLGKNLDREISIVKDNDSKTKINLNLQTSKSLASVDYQGAVNAQVLYEANKSQVSFNLKWNW